MRICSSNMKFLVPILFLFAVAGCKNDLPPGMPRLTKCEIVITSENKPVEGVFVTLIPRQEGLEKWPSAGTTDTEGKAKIVTFGQYPGVPAASYKVVLNKVVRQGGEKDDETTPIAKREKIQIFSLVDKKYTVQETTPLELTVENSAVSQTYDIGAPTKVQLETIIPGKSM